MNRDEGGDDRLVQLETALMHVQRDLELLNQAVLAQQREIDALRKALARFAEMEDRGRQLSAEQDESAGPISRRGPLE